MNDLDDVPLPIELPICEPRHEEEIDPMSALPVGSVVRAVPNLTGKWSVWSQSSESPGAHFLVPLDDEARAVGIKYAVVRCRVPRGTATPILTLLRTDPYIKGLCD